MARAMTEAGASVHVWVDGLDPWEEMRNPEVAGIKDGVHFEFLLGKTRASSNKLRRIYDRFSLAAAALNRMRKAVHRGTLDGLYFYASLFTPEFERVIVRSEARANKFPVIIDLCEAPWAFKQKQSPVEKIISPLWGVDGVISISSFLSDWVGKENIRRSRNIPILQIPILVDVHEFAAIPVCSRHASVLFAGSPLYTDTLQFLLQAMESVWERHPDAELVLTGGTAEAMLAAGGTRGKGRIRCPGFLDRKSLLNEYAAASVLALPLFDDVRSAARFPTKLGEYLAAGKPVVTNSVGEIPNFLEDGVNASLISPGDIEGFASGICRVLDDPHYGRTLGCLGRKVAEHYFHYSQYGERLIEYFSSLRN
jgi:glycosyltransferase involved in cell wall biosynthesis